MAENVDKRLASASSHEGVPSLRIVEVNAKTVDEAMKKVGNGAGQTELGWVLDPKSAERARKLLKGPYRFFFPNTLDGGGVTFVEKIGGNFWPDWCQCVGAWYDNDRIVEVG